MKSATTILSLICVALSLAPQAFAGGSDASTDTHFMAGVGLGTTAQTNNVQGASAGVAAQFKIRSNGRVGQTLYDERGSVTYNAISSGSNGASTFVAVRNDAMIGRAVQDIRQSCSFYGGVSGYARGEVATNNNGAADSLRTMITPETGLACDVSGVLLEVAPIVGLGMAVNSSSGLHSVPARPDAQGYTVCGGTCTNLVSGATSGGSALVGGGVVRLSIGDRLHLAARGAHSIPNAVFSGGPTGDMTMAGADVDVRVSDHWSVGVTADGVQYAADPTPAAQGGSVTRYEGQLTGVATAVF